MRFLLGFLSGLIGMLAGWFGIAMLVVSLAGPDRDGGIAMGAFFQIGPIGALVGFISGLWLFSRFGLVERNISVAGTVSRQRRVALPFAVVLVVAAGSISWWTWYEFIRSPYLTHGFMTLDLRFRLPPGLSAPPNHENVRIEVTEERGLAIGSLGQDCGESPGERQVIEATASLMYKAHRRLVRLTLPGAPSETWQLDLSSDPDPTPGYSDWSLPIGPSAAKIQMSFRLRADR